MATNRSPVLFDATSGQSSTYTTASVLVADADRISISVDTRAAAASRFTVWGSNSDGFDTALAEADWSVVSTIVAPGIYTMDPGFRWNRVSRSAIESQSTVKISLLNTPYL